MNIGIIVYSETGNTLSVAGKIAETLTAAGHTAEVRQVTIEKREKTDASVRLKDIPSVDGFDLLIFGAPVQAFSLCAQMALYLKQLPDIGGLPVGCFLTQGLSKKWMGGNRAYNTMRKRLLAKGSAEPVRIGHVHWRSEERDEQIADTVSRAAKFAATAV
ncbi:MAG: flavodoxin family protein [Clostridiales bacterium]|nr:flavodoxin family protein [Clostridiales bacterium]